MAPGDGVQQADVDHCSALGAQVGVGGHSNAGFPEPASLWSGLVAFYGVLLVGGLGLGFAVDLMLRSLFELDSSSVSSGGRELWSVMVDRSVGCSAEKVGSGLRS
jgi:hypothetical protein